jgi:hypothetical protein
MPRVTIANAADYIARHEPFNAGNLTGIAGPPTSTGHLPAVDAAYLRADQERYGIAYTVLSYKTPIAYVLTDGTVVMPEARYSPTTTAHQDTTAQALKVPGVRHAWPRVVKQGALGPRVGW